MLCSLSLNRCVIQCGLFIGIQHVASDLFCVIAVDGSFMAVDAAILPAILAQCSANAQPSEESDAASVVCDSQPPVLCDSQPTVSDQNSTGTNKSTWSRDATLVLLRLYRENKPKFDSPRYKNSTIWSEIAELLKKDGFTFNAEQVEGKWKTLLAAYRRVVDHNNKSGNDRKEFQFLDEMKEILVHNPSVTPQFTISSAEGLQQHQMKMPKNKSKRKQLLLSTPTTTSTTTSTATCSTTERGVSPSTSTSSSADAKETESTASSAPRKRKHTPKKQDLMTWLEGYQSQQAAAEESRLELARKMHSDNMGLMSGLLDIMKQVVTKK